MNLNEQLQQAYEAGWRQGLNEQVQDPDPAKRRPPSPMSPLDRWFKKILDQQDQQKPDEERENQGGGGSATYLPFFPWRWRLTTDALHRANTRIT